MKLAEMSLTSAKKINKVLESRFGFAINYDSLTVEKAEKLSETITANLDKIRHSTNLHTAEKNPRYMELLTVKEGLNRWLQERAIPQTEEVEVITEGEVGNAEVLLAAKDMVDSIQDAIEKCGKMQNEQLPQLLDNGVKILTGEQTDNPMAMPGDEAEVDLTGQESELDQDETDGFAATDAATGGAEELGRELR